MRKRHAVRFFVSMSFLEQSLQLPYDMKITGITMNYSTDSALLFVECDSLPEIPEGSVPPLVSFTNDGKWKVADG